MSENIKARRISNASEFLFVWFVDYSQTWWSSTWRLKYHVTKTQVSTSNTGTVHHTECRFLDLLPHMTSLLFIPMQQEILRGFDCTSYINILFCCPQMAEIHSHSFKISGYFSVCLLVVKASDWLVQVRTAPQVSKLEHPSDSPWAVWVKNIRSHLFSNRIKMWWCGVCLFFKMSQIQEYFFQTDFLLSLYLCLYENAKNNVKCWQEHCKAELLM